jgi:NAD(P)-dependent dehydrogenase (short-subunit alcohol dehydrogenase family)
MQKSNPKKKAFKKQHQQPPGLEYKMKPEPVFFNNRPGSGKLMGKNCIITGGDSGIGRAVAVAFTNEGANVALIYLEEETQDAKDTATFIKKNFNKECLLFPSDISKEDNCVNVINKIKKKFKNIDVLVNNAAVQFPAEDIMHIESEKLVHTFSVNIFAMFWITKSVLPVMNKNACIINTTSVTAYRGSPALLDYSSTKGAIVTFTRSLASNIVEKGIRVNGVAPGPVWTPLIPSSMPAEKIETYGTDSPMKRAAQPFEIAPAYVFLASEDASYITGQIIHVNGGEVVNG